jgi:mRNA-degrading endonuclease RelE of RelBE toxin-antitoxin system
MTYAVYTTERFEKEIEKLPESDKEIIKKIYSQLAANPYIGDQIRFRFFREKRLREKRVYYMVYDDLAAVLIVAFGGKKAQEETIDKIAENFSEFRRYLENLLKN